MDRFCFFFKKLPPRFTFSLRVTIAFSSSFFGRRALFARGLGGQPCGDGGCEARSRPGGAPPRERRQQLAVERRRRRRRRRRNRRRRGGKRGLLWRRGGVIGERRRKEGGRELVEEGKREGGSWWKRERGREGAFRSHLYLPLSLSLWKEKTLSPEIK